MKRTRSSFRKIVPRELQWKQNFTPKRCWWRSTASRISRSDEVNLTLRPLRNVPGRQRRALAEEIILHLLQQELLRLLRPQVQPVLVHDHLHLLEPHFPGFLGNVLIDTLA